MRTSEYSQTYGPRTALTDARVNNQDYHIASPCVRVHNARHSPFTLPLSSSVSLLSQLSDRRSPFIKPRLNPHCVKHNRHGAPKSSLGPTHRPAQAAAPQGLAPPKYPYCWRHLVVYKDHSKTNTFCHDAARPVASKTLRAKFFILPL
jgi:hypothetical protein